MNLEMTTLEGHWPAFINLAGLAAHALARVGFILVVGYVAVRLLRGSLQHLETVLIRAGQTSELVPGAAEKRVRTLAGMLRTLGLVTIWAVVAVLALANLGFDLTPLIASAGIAGLAVGFGAQNIVRDLISGFFVVLENQVRVGDVAVVNGTGGLVEVITFRTIVLRDLAGVVHVFPHGSVNTLANTTLGWSAYVIDLGVAYKEDTDRVVAVMREVDEEIRKDPAFRPHILEPIEVFGVDAFGESEVVIKARIKTRPIQQWSVGREYRRRLKKALDGQGIEIPFPHRSLYVGEATKPFRVLVQHPGGSDSEPRG